MARKPTGQTNISNSPAASRSSQSASGSEDMISEPLSRAEDVVNLNSLREEISEVKELARTLMSAVQEARAQAARADSVRGALEDVKADVRAASQAIMAAPSPSVARAVSPAVGQFENAHGAAECGPCQCVSSGCCAFEIVLDKVRVAQAQNLLEFFDAGSIGNLIRQTMEVQVYFTADGVGIVWPSLAGTVKMEPFLLPPGPSSWHNVTRVANTIQVPKGSSVVVKVDAEVKESDDDGLLEHLLQGADDYGQADGMITLDCCMDKIYPPGPLDVHLAGPAGGMIQMTYYARRVCC
jgi:hypothetical protein